VFVDLANVDSNNKLNLAEKGNKVVDLLIICVLLRLITKNFYYLQGIDGETGPSFIKMFNTT
jgi:hypothetical protein